MPRKPKRYAAVVPETPYHRAVNALFAASCFVDAPQVDPVCWITARRAVLYAKRLIAEIK
jgi:hypothetical protein